MVKWRDLFEKEITQEGDEYMDFAKLSWQKINNPGYAFDSRVHLPHRRLIADSSKRNQEIKRLAEIAWASLLKNTAIELLPITAWQAAEEMYKEFERRGVN